MAEWRTHIDKDLANHLEKLIEHSNKHKHAFEKSENPAKAQMWIALSLLSKQLHDFHFKLNEIESKLNELPQFKGKKAKIDSSKILNKLNKEVEALESADKIAKSLVKKK